APTYQPPQEYAIGALGNEALAGMSAATAGPPNANPNGATARRRFQFFRVISTSRPDSGENATRIVAHPSVSVCCSCVTVQNIVDRQALGGGGRSNLGRGC